MSNVNSQTRTYKYLKLTRCDDAISMVDRTKKTPSGGKVMTLFKDLFSTSITCKTSPALVPKTGAFLMMKSCSFSVVHSNRQVAEREEPVVMVSRPTSATASIAWIILSSFSGSDWVFSPRSWSEMMLRRWFLAEKARDWSMSEDRVEVTRIWRWRRGRRELKLGDFR